LYQDQNELRSKNLQALDKYLASYGILLNPGIKIEFCPRGVDVSSTPPKEEGVYMHPQVLALG